MYSARYSLTANPRSASSIAGANSGSSGIVPHRSNIASSASSTVGVEAASTPSLTGILPPACVSNHSIVAIRGAFPAALIDTTLRSRAGYTRTAASPPSPVIAGSVIINTATPAAAASNAFPPSRSTCSAACVACGFRDDTAYRWPRITGRVVRVTGCTRLFVKQVLRANLSEIREFRLQTVRHLRTRISALQARRGFVIAEQTHNRVQIEMVGMKLEQRMEQLQAHPDRVEGVAVEKLNI